MNLHIRIMEQRLIRDNNLPPEFAFFSWACFPPTAERLLYVELKGGVCPLYKSGPNKGQRNWGKAAEKRTFQVTPDEDARWGQDYEAETGNCMECLGEGKTVSRMGVGISTEYRPCRHCESSGKAVALISEPQ